uniref:Uncharacterized protein n=1 Tax=Corvus moneduloides TaxID=1196302 RepID=A0A8C3DA42_CORMO
TQYSHPYVPSCLLDAAQLWLIICAILAQVTLQRNLLMCPSSSVARFRLVFHPILK